MRRFAALILALSASALTAVSCAGGKSSSGASSQKETTSASASEDTSAETDTTSDTEPVTFTLAPYVPDPPSELVPVNREGSGKYIFTDDAIPEEAAKVLDMHITAVENNDELLANALLYAPELFDALRSEVNVSGMPTPLKEKLDKAGKTFTDLKFTGTRKFTDEDETNVESYYAYAAMAMDMGSFIRRVKDSLIVELKFGDGADDVYNVPMYMNTDDIWLIVPPEHIENTY
jgi:hypothetical protein